MSRVLVHRGHEKTQLRNFVGHGWWSRDVIMRKNESFFKSLGHKIHQKAKLNQDVFL